MASHPIRLAKRIEDASWLPLVAHLDDVAQLRIDLIGPAAPAEGAVMADASLHVMRFHVLAQDRRPGPW